MHSNIRILRFALDVKGGLAVGGAPKRHSVFSQSRPGWLHFGR